MPLLLTNQDVIDVLSMDDCLAATEQAFLELGNGTAVSRPRSDLVVRQPEPGRHYLLKTWDAALPGVGLVAIRITSNMMQVVQGETSRRLEPLPLAGPGGFVGLVLLFDLRSLELVGIIQDARIQVMRAGATYGLAAKYLARADSKVMGIIGSGQQAREQLAATSLVRKLRLVKVFSPTRANRERFADSMSKQLGIEVVACTDVRQVVEGSDIVASTTTSLEPLYPGDWLQPGQHVTSCRGTELDDVTRSRASLIVLQTDQQIMLWTPKAQTQQQGAWRPGEQKIEGERLAFLPDIVAGHHPGRTSPDQITLFGAPRDTFGPGTAYAAAGAVALKKARERGIGREIPAEWFIQQESS
jgi:alanine dehydrogenase